MRRLIISLKKYQILGKYYLVLLENNTKYTNIYYFLGGDKNAFLASSASVSVLAMLR